MSTVYINRGGYQLASSTAPEGGTYYELRRWLDGDRRSRVLVSGWSPGVDHPTSILDGMIRHVEESRRLAEIAE